MCSCPGAEWARLWRELLKLGSKAAPGPCCPPSCPPGDSSELWGEDGDGRGFGVDGCLNSTGVIPFLLSSPPNGLICRKSSAWSDLRGSRCNYLSGKTVLADKTIKVQWYTLVNLMLITSDVRCDWKAQSHLLAFHPQKSILSSVSRETADMQHNVSESKIWRDSETRGWGGGGGVKRFRRNIPVGEIKCPKIGTWV